MYASALSRERRAINFYDLQNKTRFLEIKATYTESCGKTKYYDRSISGLRSEGETTLITGYSSLETQI